MFRRITVGKFYNLGVCGRYSQAANLEEIARRYGIPVEIIRLDPIIPRYNLAPTQKSVVVLGGPDGKTRLTMLTWGITPPWAKPENKVAPIVNLRAETLLGKPAFKKFLQSSRCIVPVDGFYEWKNLVE